MSCVWVTEKYWNIVSKRTRRQKSPSVGIRRLGVLPDTKKPCRLRKTTLNFRGQRVKIISLSLLTGSIYLFQESQENTYAWLNLPAQSLPPSSYSVEITHCLFSDLLQVPMTLWVMSHKQGTSFAETVQPRGHIFIHIIPIRIKETSLSGTFTSLAPHSLLFYEYPQPTTTYNQQAVRPRQNTICCSDKNYMHASTTLPEHNLKPI